MSERGLYQQIREFGGKNPMADFKPLMDLVRENWWLPEWGWTEKRGGRYYISTGGHSDNEQLIAQMQENWAFWVRCWWSSRRGGRYEFRLPKKKKGAR